MKKRARIIEVSHIWQTKAVGSSGPDFLNQAVLIQTEIGFEDLKNLTLRAIERQLGRVRTIDKYADRTMDMDIIIFDDQVMDPAVWTQCFIASPISDLHPDLQSPANGSRLLDIAKEMQCKSDVRIYDDNQSAH